MSLHFIQLLVIFFDLSNICFSFLFAVRCWAESPYSHQKHYHSIINNATLSGQRLATAPCGTRSQNKIIHSTNRCFTWKLICIKIQVKFKLKLSYWQFNFNSTSGCAMCILCPIKSYIQRLFMTSTLYWYYYKKLVLEANLGDGVYWPPEGLR